MKHTDYIKYWWQDYKFKIEDKTALKANEFIALSIAVWFLILWVSIKINFWDFLFV